MIPSLGGQERDTSAAPIREALRESLMEIRLVCRKGSLTTHFLVTHAHAADLLMFSLCLTEEGRRDWGKGGRVDREGREGRWQFRNYQNLGARPGPDPPSITLSGSTALPTP